VSTQTERTVRNASPPMVEPTTGVPALSPTEAPLVTHPRRRSLLLSLFAVLLVSVGCRGSSTHQEPLETPPFDGPIDEFDGRSFGPPSYDSPMNDGGYDSNTLRPVPSSGPLPSPSGTQRAPIPLPGPGASGRGRPAPAMPTARRDDGAMPIEGDRGLMPTSGRNDAATKSGRFWPFGKSEEARPQSQPPESERWPRDPNGAQRRFEMMPPPAPGITKRLRDEDRYLARGSAGEFEHNPVRIEGLEFDASPTELAGGGPRFESNLVPVSPRLVTPREPNDDSAADWRLAEGGSVVEVNVATWPFGAPRPGQAVTPEPFVSDEVPNAASLAVPVSATAAGDRTVKTNEEPEPIPFDLDAPLPVITPGLQRSEPRYLPPAPASVRRSAPRQVSLPTPVREHELEADDAAALQPPILTAPGTNPLID
jgi:hypothetical protein